LDGFFVLATGKYKNKNAQKRYKFHEKNLEMTGKYRIRLLLKKTLAKIILTRVQRESLNEIVSKV